MSIPNISNRPICNGYNIFVPISSKKNSNFQNQPTAPTLIHECNIPEEITALLSDVDSWSLANQQD